eukprot:scaffold132_cov170-Amphora_coffeaeformis.AAC.26
MRLIFLDELGREGLESETMEGPRKTFALPDIFGEMKHVPMYCEGKSMSLPRCIVHEASTS